MEEDITKPMPHNKDAERAILSCVLQWPDHSDAVFAHSEGDNLFYNPAHKHLFTAIRNLRDANEPVDMVTLTTALRSADRLESVGGASYIAELQTDLPTPSLLPQYLKLASECAKRRTIIADCWRVSAAAFDDKSKVETLVQDLDNTTQRIFRSVSAPKETRMNQVVLEAVEQIQERSKSGGKIPGLSYGMLALDIATNGMQPGQMIVVAARPGIGKTSLALNFGEHVASQGIPTAIFSAEMVAYELGIRSLSGASGIDSLRLASGNLNKQELGKLHTAIAKVSQLPIWIDDRADMRLIDIQATTRKLVKEQGVKLAIVDYLQLIREPEGSRNREDAVRRLSSGLKNLAKDLDIPIVVLSQLNRSSEKREGRKPSLSDLRDSGSIEQDANVVMLLHADDEGQENETVIDMDVIVAKCRGGRLGPVAVEFHRPITAFRAKERQE